ncbi:MAG: STAS domain-containing protein [Candidatus Kapabacteria bacterium]|nr:STAS domain-containing protein [Candidatus Kapabacteria bacterium]
MSKTPNTFIADVRQGPNDTCLIDLTGYLDAHTASDLEQVIKAAFDGGCRRFVVNFADLDYISSAGLGVFMVFIEDVKRDSGDIKMAAMKDKVFTVFDLLGFQVLFDIFNTVDEAVIAFPDAQ